jgi:PAS domain S-box-containing protein
MSLGNLLVASSHGPELQTIIRSHFAEDALTVEVWSDSVPLFSRLSEQTAHLLLLDLSLLRQISPPGPFFTTLKTVSSITEVLLLVTGAERDQAIEALQLGATDYLLLPVSPQELSFKIEKLLEIQTLRQAALPVAPSDSLAHELLMLRQAGQEINHTLQLDEVLKIVLSNASQITTTHLAKIYLADQSGNLAEERCVTKTSPLMDRLEEARLLFSLAQEAALSQEIIYRKNGTSDLWQQQCLKAALLIPLVSGDKLIGVLALGNRQATGFAPNHVRWLSVFCAQAATSIENARLFQALASAYIDLAQSREQILQSRNTLQVLFDGISDGLYILDRDLTMTALNRVAAERQGYQVEALIGESYLSLPWGQAAPELLNCIKEALQTGHETTWISPEYETDPYLKDREFRIYPIRNRLAQIEQVIVFAQDVSERRRWQASLFRSANLAAVGQLAGSVAHQINNPLTVAMANSQLILLEADPASDLYELTQGIFKAGERIQNIVENLLEFSNQETYFFVQTDLVNTIEGALALVFRSLKKANIEVIKSYAVQPILSASISHLKLVWMNILLNARDAVIGYAKAPRITIATEPVSEREVKVIIADNGVGIPEKDFERLFRPFFTTKLASQAIGLGLYSTHTIIERHNGQIRVSSQPGVETRFEVILPLDNPRDL